MKHFLLPAVAALCLIAGCRNSAPLKPSVSGKAGEVLVVIDREDWEGRLGETVRGILADDYPFLPIKEPRYSVVNVAPGAFGNLFKVHRNIVFIDIRHSAVPQVTTLRDKWAAPQCVMQVSARSSDEADSVFRANAPLLVETFEQAERDRVIANTLLYENRDIHAAVAPIFGGAPHFPTGFRLRKNTGDFVWISDDKQYTIQGVFIYRYPATGDPDRDFDNLSIISHRNSVMQDNVPGMFDNTYMTTGTYMPPTTRFLRYKGRQFAETHGWWEVQGDFMGGPFVCHSFYSQDGRQVIVEEAFVYAAKFDKRQYLRQTESLLYSWEWK